MSSSGSQDPHRGPGLTLSPGSQNKRKSPQEWSNGKNHSRVKPASAAGMFEQTDPQLPHVLQSHQQGHQSLYPLASVAAGGLLSQASVARQQQGAAYGSRPVSRSDATVDPFMQASPFQIPNGFSGQVEPIHSSGPVTQAILSAKRSATAGEPAAPAKKRRVESGVPARDDGGHKSSKATPMSTRQTESSHQFQQSSDDSDLPSNGNGEFIARLESMRRSRDLPRETDNTHERVSNELPTLNYPHAQADNTRKVESHGPENQSKEVNHRGDGQGVNGEPFSIDEFEMSDSRADQVRVGSVFGLNSSSSSDGVDMNVRQANAIQHNSIVSNSSGPSANETHRISMGSSHSTQLPQFTMTSAPGSRTSSSASLTSPASSTSKSLHRPSNGVPSDKTSAPTSNPASKEALKALRRYMLPIYHALQNRIDESAELVPQVVEFLKSSTPLPNSSNSNSSKSMDPASFSRGSNSQNGHAVMPRPSLPRSRPAQLSHNGTASTTSTSHLTEPSHNGDASRVQQTPLQNVSGETVQERNPMEMPNGSQGFDSGQSYRTTGQSGLSGPAEVNQTYHSNHPTSFFYGPNEAIDFAGHSSSLHGHIGANDSADYPSLFGPSEANGSADNPSSLFRPIETIDFAGHPFSLYGPNEAIDTASHPSSLYGPSEAIDIIDHASSFYGSSATSNTVGYSTPSYQGLGMANQASPTSIHSSPHISSALEQPSTRQGLKTVADNSRPPTAVSHGAQRSSMGSLTFEITTPADYGFEAIMERPTNELASFDRRFSAQSNEIMKLQNKCQKLEAQLATTKTFNAQVIQERDRYKKALGQWFVENPKTGMTKLESTERMSAQLQKGYLAKRNEVNRLKEQNALYMKQCAELDARLKQALQRGSTLTGLQASSEDVLRPSQQYISPYANLQKTTSHIGSSNGSHYSHGVVSNQINPDQMSSGAVSNANPWVMTLDGLTNANHPMTQNVNFSEDIAAASSNGTSSPTQQITQDGEYSKEPGAPSVGILVSDQQAGQITEPSLEPQDALLNEKSIPNVPIAQNEHGSHAQVQAPSSGDSSNGFLTTRKDYGAELDRSSPGQTLKAWYEDQHQATSDPTVNANNQTISSQTTSSSTSTAVSPYFTPASSTIPPSPSEVAVYSAAPTPAAEAEVIDLVSPVRKTFSDAPWKRKASDAFSWLGQEEDNYMRPAKKMASYDHSLARRRSSADAATAEKVRQEAAEKVAKAAKAAKEKKAAALRVEKERATTARKVEAERKKVAKRAEMVKAREEKKKERAAKRAEEKERRRQRALDEELFGPEEEEEEEEPDDDDDALLEEELARALMEDVEESSSGPDQVPPPRMADESEESEEE
ncbi:MAG: hypothetical protein M1819_007060 [Sarea resinae]|nr:MAG: hypothetical protein M1819_007060 [Sarea resinae]